MSNNLHLLGKLKDLLVNSDNFSEIMHYFFDNLAENEGFLQLGKEQPNKLVEQIVAEAASQALGQRAVVSGMHLIRLPAQKFCHGPCFVNGMMATLFYFEDIRTGLMGISIRGSNEMRYTRITAVSIQKDTQAKWN